MPAALTLHDRIRGCLFAGAVGDALGGPIEFESLEQIRRYGPTGITGFVTDAPAITDDTQMTLFTAEGLIRASVRFRQRGICHPPSVVHNAYLRWLHTQERGFANAPHLDGWLVQQPVLHQRRAPGNTCLSALRSGRMGTRADRINDSKGCGGVMRAAPVGLMLEDPGAAFELGCDIAADTHGHPTGFLAAGALAAIVNRLVAGVPLPEAVAFARELLVATAESEETVMALDAGVALAAAGQPAPEALEGLGGAWVAEEALAIGVCAALAAPSPSAGLLLAVNHSGDSDSTGSIAGNLLGTAHGLTPDVVPWFDRIDAAAVISRIADDLWTERTNPPSDDDASFWAHDVPKTWSERYPGD